MNRARAVSVAVLVAFSACGPANEGTPGGRRDAAPVDAAVDGAVDAGADAAPDAAPDASIDAPAVPPSLDGRVTINEVMAANVLTAVDETGAAGDWIELYNPTGQPLALGGYQVSDDPAMLGRAVIPAGVAVPAGGYLVLWLDDAPERGPRHLGFELARDGGVLILSRPDGTPIDRIAYGAQAIDFSAAREPDGSDAWRIEWHPTPGAANPAGPGAPVGLEDPAMPPEMVPAAGDLGDQLLGDDAFPQLELTLSPASFTSLESAPFTYVPATITFRGRTYGPIGVRLKGQNSFEPITAKPSLRIDIDRYVDGAELFGLEGFALDNMDDDLSMMHERMAYMIARRAGVPASRATHAWVTLNGMPYGLYTALESVKPRMLRRWFADSTGPLYEATDVDFLPQYIPAYAHEGGPDDRTHLAGLAAALASGPPDVAIAAAASHVDLAAFQSFWAMTSVIGQFDSMPYSDPGDDYFVYVDPTSQRIRFLPWGMDETFYSPEVDVVSRVHAILATTCRAVPACLQGYADRAWALVGLLESMNLVGEQARIAADIGPYVAMDTRKPYTTDTVLTYQRSVRNFIANRRATIAPFLPPPSP